MSMQVAHTPQTQFGHVLIKPPYNNDVHGIANAAIDAANAEGKGPIMSNKTLSLGEQRLRAGYAFETAGPEFDKYFLAEAAKLNFQAEAIDDTKLLALKNEKTPWKEVLLYPFLIETPKGFHPVGYKLLALLNWPSVVIAKVRGKI